MVNPSLSNFKADEVGVAECNRALLGFVLAGAGLFGFESAAALALSLGKGPMPGGSSDTTCSS